MTKKKQRSDSVGREREREKELQKVGSRAKSDNIRRRKAEDARRRPKKRGTLLHRNKTGTNEKQKREDRTCKSERAQQ